MLLAKSVQGHFGVSSTTTLVGTIWSAMEGKRDAGKKKEGEWGRSGPGEWTGGESHPRKGKRTSFV